MPDAPRVPDAPDDAAWMARATAAAATVRAFTSPNPWVGAVVVAADGRVFEGATQPPGGPHAEVVALARAGEAARGSTLYVTLEPCDHQGRTGPCTAAILDAGVARVVVGVRDPDPQVAGRGLDRLRSGGVDVSVLEGTAVEPVHDQLAPYLHHRRTGRPWVVLKLAATLDGRTAAADGTSQWITGPEARADAHRLRAESDAVVVGAGTVRADDPALTVRLPDEAVPSPARWPLDALPDATRPWRQPRRVVLGRAPAGARLHPCLEWTREDGDLGDLLDRLGADGVVQVMVEGGAAVAAAFHRARLVQRYRLYLAPALTGGDDGRGMFAGPGAPTMDGLWRGRIVDVARCGADLRVDLEP